VRELEDATKLVECFGANNQCIITPGCQLKQAFYEALDSFYHKLEEYTLQDMLGPGNKAKLAKILSIK
jgi:Rrf2 family nitric oxide-sensitive transcriptional repressor